jgi:hypothetical protein
MEFRIDNFTYRTSRPMDAMVQMDVLSKFAPVLTSGVTELVPFFLRAKAEGLGSIENASMDIALTALNPVAKALSAMTKADRMEIIEACLDLCDRKEAGKEGWSKIWNVDVHRAMYDDINNDSILMVRIVWKVIEGTFQRFFQELRSNLSGQQSA